MLQIQILPGNPEIVAGVSAKTGQPYKIVKQAAVVQFSNGTVSALSIQPPKGKDPYPPGKYDLAPDSFYSKDGSLAFAPKLTPAAAGGVSK
jgi:hypothetical protein